jgi:TRAP-type uncharacterized transport system substrate-binding protein
MNLFVGKLTPMHPQLLKRLLILASVTMLVLLAWFALSFHFKLYRQVNLNICAGRQNGEGYQFAEAIKKVVDKHYAYKIKSLDIIETPGSEANSDSITRGSADFALLQADVEHFPDNGGIVAILYADKSAKAQLNQYLILYSYLYTLFVEDKRSFVNHFFAHFI